MAARTIRACARSACIAVVACHCRADTRASAAPVAGCTRVAIVAWQRIVIHETVVEQRGYARTARILGVGIPVPIALPVNQTPARQDFVIAIINCPARHVSAFQDRLAARYRSAGTHAVVPAEIVDRAWITIIAVLVRITQWDRDILAGIPALVLQGPNVRPHALPAVRIRVPVLPGPLYICKGIAANQVLGVCVPAAAGQGQGQEHGQQQGRAKERG
jgi:hypothetical protein